MQALHNELGTFIDLAVNATEQDWLAQSACEGWATRDVVGHLTDTTQTYLARYIIALNDWPAPEPIGMGSYTPAINEGAVSFRHIPQFELIGRLKGPSDRLMEIFDNLTDDQWAGLMVHHKFARPVPSFMMVMFQLLDYVFHVWDIKIGLNGDAHMSVEGAGVLASLMPTLMMMSFDAGRAGSDPFELALDVKGPYGATSVVSYKDGQFQIVDGDISGVSTVITYDTEEDFCLENFGRRETGKITGDTAQGERFKTLFNWL